MTHNSSPKLGLAAAAIQYCSNRSTLRDAARRAFDGPILAKDFFIDPRQVVEARGLKQVTDTGAIDAAIDNDMGDMEAELPVFPRHALGDHAQPARHQHRQVGYRCGRGRGRRLFPARRSGFPVPRG